MEAEDPDLEAAARRYEDALRAVLAPPPHAPPVLDLLWLGLGPDGHTASLFPGSPALTVRDRWVVPVTVNAPIAQRLTLTVPVLSAARKVVFLVTGADKADAVAAVIEGEPDPERWPAQYVRPAPGRLVWILDEPAAAKLKRTRAAVIAAGEGEA
jgi:6-phosphogluconolactonase